MRPDNTTIIRSIIDMYLKLTADEQRLVLAIYRTMTTTGRPAPLRDVARAAGWLPPDAATTVGRWAAVMYDDTGAITGFGGLSTEPVTRHRLEIDGVTTWTWCALDPLFIVPLLDVTATLTSVCPVTDREIALTVSPKGIADLDPSTAVISLLLPTRAFDDDVRHTVCEFIHLFASSDAAADWTTRHDATFWLPVDDAFTVANEASRHCFSTLVR